MHLSGADSAWLKVDYDFDGKLDMEFRYSDSDRDGVIDTWDIDLDGDGKADRTTHVANPHPQLAPAAYQAFTTFYNRSLEESLSANQKLINELKAALSSLEPEFLLDSIESYYTNELANYRKEVGVGLNIKNSRAGTRYYQDLIRERYFYRLTKALANRPQLLKRVESAYESGDYAQTAKLLSSEFPQAAAVNEWPAGFSKRIAIRVHNAGGGARLKEPIALDISAVRRKAPDFNVHNFTVITGTNWIAASELPSQGDDDGIVFLCDIRANENSDYWLYYSPSGKRQHTGFTGATASMNGTAGLRWESAKIAYAFDNGKMSFSGKQPTAAAPTDAGVEALQPGDSAGLGGLTIWENGKRYPLFEGLTPVRFERRIISHGPIKATVEVSVLGFKTNRNRYDIRERFSIYRDGRYSQNSLIIRPARASGPIRFSLGFTRLPNDQVFFQREDGYFGSWGRQNNIVQEIGQAAIVAKRSASLEQQANQRDVLLTVSPGETFTWYSAGDWRRGRIFPVAPNASNWERDVRALAMRLHSPLQVRIGNAEQR
jgi:hypothetical protein